MSAPVWRQRIDDSGVVIEVTPTRGSNLPVVRIVGDYSIELTGVQTAALAQLLPEAIQEWMRQASVPPPAPPAKKIDINQPGFGAAVLPGARVGPSEPYRGNG